MTKKRGRPTKSAIRQNIVELLNIFGQAHGYSISKKYQEIFPQVTQRVIYYHLRKGMDLKEFEISKIEKETGEFSWGSTVEKTYYKLGPNAQPKGDKRLKELKAK
ncbi:MAG TPA: hypothetical protein VJB66_05425 [Candidatus Nanoarchaeia archaeon]|nr:hypothetical protein [Candidatus Nanoarchaeia archaeon]